MKTDLEKVIAGKRPKMIGITKVEKHHTIGFRCCYPDDSGRDMNEYFDNYSTAKGWFDGNKMEIADIQLFVVLMNKKGDALDEEIIESYFEE